MHKNGPVIYIDGLGKEREATVVDINPMHPEYMTLGYFDDLGNPQKVFDVPHFTHPSRQEMQTVKDRFGNEVQQGNPGLPTYPVNCYKERDEDHNALPADHPGFDHPFKLAEYDQQGTRIPVERPEYDKELAEHKAELPNPSEEDSGLKIETKVYSDGSSATGPAPLPELSPEQQDFRRFADAMHAAHERDVQEKTELRQQNELLQAKLAATTEGKDAALQAVADEHALPSVADLDADAAEKEAKEATKDTGKKSKPVLVGK